MKNLSGVAALALLAVLSGCGQKGALVLPDAPRHKRPVPDIPQLNKPRSDAPPGGETTPASPTDKPDPDKPVAQPAASSP